jgi:hypothetical protein
VLADDDDGVDREFRSTAADGFGDGGIDLEAEFAGAGSAQIVGGFLIDIQRDDLDVGLVPFAGEGVADQETIADVLGVGEIFVDRRDDRDPLRLLLGEGRGGEGGALDEPATGDLRHSQVLQ